MHILRSIPNKLAGVLALILSILVLILLSFLGHSHLRSSEFRPFYKYIFYIFFIDSIILCWIGSQPVDVPFVLLGRIFTVLYFSIIFYFFTFNCIFRIIFL
jgi:ubiquinol-cytochrome c reductase cytochrome b subunit